MSANVLISYTLPYPTKNMVLISVGGAVFESKSSHHHSKKIVQLVRTVNFVKSVTMRLSEKCTWIVWLLCAHLTSFGTSFLG